MLSTDPLYSVIINISLCEASLHVIVVPQLVRVHYCSRKNDKTQCTYYMYVSMYPYVGWEEKKVKWFK